jgi:hypothetical protein
MRLANPECDPPEVAKRPGQGNQQQPKPTKNMRNYCKTIGALAAASALVAGTASAEIEYNIGTGYTNEYLFRGLNLGQDLVEASLNAQTEWNGFGLKAGAWYGSYDFSTPFGEYDIDELDISAEINRDFGILTAAVGYIYYMNEDQFNLIDDAQEVYFAISQTYFGIDASLAYFWDIETDNDGYLAGTLSKSIELSPCLSLYGGGTLAYLVEQSELAHLTVKTSLDWAFTETATLSPFIAYSWALTEDGAYLGSRNEFVGGAMLSVGF